MRRLAYKLGPGEHASKQPPSWTTVSHTCDVLAILRTPRVLPLFVASCVARLPMGALGLLLVLHTHDLTGSYGRGGLATGVYLVALGVSAPLLARLVDRRGQTAVPLVGALAEAAAITTP